ncbi:MAG: Uncharacterised protein [Methanobacteriota archaeon]|nr:MAG: Uncharacterised protein [Euryarchaeota archaeon]
MKRANAVMLVLIITLQAFFGIVSSSTPETITIDGDISEWSTESLLQTNSNGITYSVTWDSENLYFSWNGTDWASLSEGADLFIYFNTTSGGSVLSKDWNFAHTLPFAADYGFVLEDSNYNTMITFNDSSWEDQTTIVDLYTGWSDNKATEISIPWSSIGSPETFQFMAYSQWQDEGNVWASFPIENPANSNGAETFTHYWDVENINNPTIPSSLPIIEVGEIEKVDDALNLAIVFHQHQPYYKNKLTNTYEMPWVRVHAMTEYVDSPGILAETGTKVTYNLVPSFIEQLVDYNLNEPLDVHTDIAKRPWPEGGYPNATELELHTMQFQSFWNSGWIYNVSETNHIQSWLYPSSSRYSELYDMTLHNLKPNTIMDDDLLSPQEFLDLQVLWYLYQFSPDYVQGKYNLSHRDQGLIDLFMQNGQYNHDDLMYVVDSQHQHMANVLPMYSELAANDQIELTTTPYYHPIMPLLMMDGWTMEDGIRVNKEAWPEDVQNHLITGMDFFEEELGFRPTGMWPSEEAVSPEMVQPVSDVGVQWMVTDEELLKQSTDSNGLFIDADDVTKLATPWIVTGEDGGEVTVIFRDRVISDRIAFQYGKMTPEAAVSDFISYLDNVRQQLLDAGEDPSEHLLTVALDGENWMFMSEFQHQDNARPFMEEWYSRLANHPTIVTTTPSEFLEKNTTLPEIETIGTGSWIDGTLRTWAGEAEESLAWQRLIEARSALVDFEQENPNHIGLETAWESLYIAEGSDWFWWYGLDQDSGYDENWDTLFKVHLSNIYRAINLDLPPYLQDLWTGAATPETAYGGIIEPMVDGIALPGEWDDAAKYDAPIDGGDFNIDEFYIGYDSSNVFLRIDADTPTEFNENNRDSINDSPDLAIYFMQPNAINFNEVETNFRTYYGNQIIGFPAKYMVAFDFDTLREDGRAKWNLFTAKGKSGDQEQWVLSGSSSLGNCAVKDVYEFKIPWSDIGLAPRYSTRVKVVSSWAASLSYSDGVDMEMAPPAPSELVLPDLEEWVTLLELNDTVGDETGDGDYTYPLASDFATPNGGGLWDATKVTIRQSAWNAQFIIEMGEMTDIWGLSNGFSHQIVQIYVDQGLTEYGKTEMLTGANAEIHPDWAWEVAISGTGEPGAVMGVKAETGSTSARGIDVFGDVNSKTITFTISKDVIGSDVPNYRYIVVIGSQDGFGTGKWRDVDTTASTWTLGGGAEPSPEDGIDYDPNIIDIILDGEGQQSMLSSYDVNGQVYAQLTGFEMPEIAQQIYGFKHVSSTSNSALFEWSTTREDSGIIECIEVNNNTNIITKIWNGTGLSHTTIIDGLIFNTSYSCQVIIESLTSDIINFTTSSIVDETPPDLLNLAVEVFEDGRVRISWYTSESSTENIYLNEQLIYQYDFATKKNHEFITEPLSDGVWNLEVISADASGNSNSSLLEFTVEAGVQEDQQEDTNNDDTTPINEEKSSLMTSTNIQIGLLIVVLLVIITFIRVLQNDSKDDDKWS